MKKKNALSIGVALVFAFVAVLGGMSITASANSINQLSAKASDYCSSCGGCASDCGSGATGNIYPGMEGANF
jgi:hypothetical protein